MRAGSYGVNSRGHEFVSADERLTYDSSVSLRSLIEATNEFSGRNIHFEWSSGESFIRQQADPGIDIPCLFPRKFRHIRPLHNPSTPCCLLKRSIASPSETSVEDVWNGEVMVGTRTELAARKVPRRVPKLVQLGR